MNFLSTDAHAKRLRYNENAFVILALQAFDNIDKRLAFKTFEGKIGSPDFQGAYRFQDSSFKSAINSHDFARRFHLRP